MLIESFPIKFGEYVLLDRIASGGMAEVFVAKTEGLSGFERLVAIKVIREKYSSDAEFVRMLVDEAKLSVRLNHPNIGQTFDLAQHDESFFIVMELIEGIDTARLLERAQELGARLPIDLCAYIGREVCRALHYAHTQKEVTGESLNVVHRDVSPQNVMVSYSGEVKVVDFGIAKAKSRTSKTQVGVIKGKYCYMSPEQAWGEKLDGRTDTFATSLVLQELLTGKRVYDGVQISHLLTQVREVDVVPPSARRSDVPKELEAILLKATEVERADRYASAKAMGDALDEFLHNHFPGNWSSRLSALVVELFPPEHDGEHDVLATDPNAPNPTLTGNSSTELEVLEKEEFKPHSETSVLYRGAVKAHETIAHKKRVPSTPRVPEARPTKQQTPTTPSVKVELPKLGAGNALGAQNAPSGQEPLPRSTNSTSANSLNDDSLDSASSSKASSNGDAAPGLFERLKPLHIAAALLLMLTLTFVLSLFGESSVVHVVSVPPGATVVVDGEVLATPTPTTIEGSPGDSVSVEVRAMGFETWQGEIEFPASDVPAPRHLTVLESSNTSQ